MWIAIFCLSGLGLLASLGLGFVSRRFVVEVDPRIEAVERVLSGTNCGVCGYPSCSHFARAIVEEGAPVSGCIAGGEDTALALAKLMGVEAVTGEKKVAVVLCKGGKEESTTKFTYRGVEDCKAAVIISDGDKACSYGCLGLGTCEKVCPFDAVEISEDGLAIIDPEKCTGCGICVKECPKGIIQLVPVEKGVSILCHSDEKGSEVQKKCAVGCIACEICIRVCPFDAITMEGNLAVLDHERCRVCGLCIPRCPTETIHGRDWPFPHVEIIEDRCTGCGICTMICPVDAIEGEEKEVHMVSKERCVGCMLCVDRCPEEAIRVKAQSDSASELAA
ncbi:MAG: RnfABCDGE type electron transport complex subunit B [Syntrophobacterales bacterium]|nr:MAG: RnfABCDGE type electron transport complex subunit B [Syntrophobacterales bacterium]